MSRLLRLWLGKNELSISMVERTRRGEVHLVTLSRRAFASTQSVDAWVKELSDETVLDALKESVQKCKADQRNFNQFNIVVSDAYCRHVVLPRPVGLRHAGELQASLRARFHTNFGDERDEENRWYVHTDCPPWGTHDLVCGIRQTLFNALCDVARRAKLTLSRIQSFWMWCHDQQGRVANPVGDVFCLLASEGRAHTIAFFVRGQCIGVRGTQCGAYLTSSPLDLTTEFTPELTPELAILLRREVSLYGGLGDLGELDLEQMHVQVFDVHMNAQKKTLYADQDSEYDFVPAAPAFFLDQKVESR